MSHVAALVEQAAQRSRGYWLLSRLFLEVPSAAQLTELLGVLTEHGLLAMSDEIAALRKAAAATLARPEDAAVAFTRHLVLGDKASREPLPYEAHVVEGRLPGDCTEQVRAIMLGAGYAEVAPEAPSPDHLGAELRFMALLCHAEHRAWQQNDPIAAARNLALQKAFLGEHLASWAPGYCRGLAARTTNAFLAAVANLTAATVADDVAVVAEISDWIAPLELAEHADRQYQSPTIQ